ncbi:TetR/AcrR family transcriptional regulator [Rhizobium wuzhouense]|uniref:TetR family transcriptional regulator n=1 Tax=Rhizobium wuzhouense TaxID=1986026 RepID=A0ABX5NZF8_9HYPH|nr:TetR/AcrR family transcriptional regulator [Rhizobium wuzhouense]PYB76946.1 TetR family transcriptional regulator [Rhizobium wuzhouense]
MGQRDTHDRIVATADDLFYRQGFDHTSFADIASAVGISRGNFYHHFKTKDEILTAVIDKRLCDRAMMMEGWQAEVADPLGRIERFIDILLVNGDKIRQHGCPIGTLTSELAKLNHAAQPQAVQLFSLFRTWLARQFEGLGRSEDADRLALELLSRSQGAATLYNAFHDRDFLNREVAAMKNWLRTVAATSRAEN